MQLKNWVLLGAAAVGAIGSFAVKAHAGFRAESPIYVSVASRYFYGALGSARNTGDSVQYLGCNVNSYSAGASTVYCYARDANNVSASCTSTAAELVQQGRAVGPDKYISVSWDANGYCTSIQVTQNSFHPPKAH
jgi:hypothetical protein